MSASAREVRKTVTILFCDLVHSTGLAEGDPEAYRRVQSRYFEEMRAIVERHGGTVEKFIGDEVMAVFGVPVVHEDDALRAVRAAQKMQEALPELDLEARIGINTGEVLVGDPDQSHGFLAGEPVIVAKRLEQGAEPGEIVIGKATYPLVENAVTAGPLERISVKGKREDVGRRRVEEVDREAPGVARRLHAPLVGRGEELELLREAFERTVEERCCRLFTVLGPAGIGKSRLAAELCASVANSATTATGRCLPYGEGITFWPLTEVLEAMGGETAVRQALAGSEQQEVVLDLLRGATGASEEAGSSEETFWAVRSAFEALARQRPLVVCFEDLHWAEPTLLDLVEYVVGWSRDAPILVLVLARPELVERRASWIAPQPNADAIALEPLSGPETEALLAGLSDEISLPDGTREQIASTAEGNPLFLEQLAAMAAEEDEDAPLSVPPSIQAVLAERLDRLTQEERETIERASVVGRDFPLSAVAALSPEEQRGSLAQHLLALVRKGLVRPDPSDEEDRFRFHHVLVRDSAYEAMPKELRARLHEQFAGWIEESSGERTLDELIGYHLEQAHRFRAEIAPGDEGAAELAGRAAEFLARAGRRAEAREDIPAALNLLDRAIVLLPRGRNDQLRAELLAEVGSLLMNAGRFQDAEPILAEARELAAKTGNRALELRIEIDRAFLTLFTEPEPTQQILAIGTSVVPELEQLGDDLGLAKAWWLLSEPHVIACRWGARAEALERGLEHARRAGDRRLQATLTGLLAGALLSGATPVDEATARCEAFLSEKISRSIEASSLSALSALRAMAGDIEEGRQLWARASAIYEELGLRHRRAMRSLIPARIALLAGNPQAAVRELRYGDELLAEMGDRGARATLTAYFADTLYAAGQLDEAYAVTELSEELSASDDIVTQAMWRCARAKVLADRGDLEAADALSLEAARLAEPTDFPDLQAATLLARAHVLRALGRPDDAAALVERARELYERKGNVAAAEQASALLSV